MATNNNKVTRVDAIETAAAFIRAHEDAWDAFGCEYTIADIIANLEGQASKMRTSAAKKRSTPTKEQLINQNLASTIADAMPTDKWVSSKWVANNIQGVMSTQKAVALMRILTANGYAKRALLKGRPVYAVAELEGEPTDDITLTC